MSNLVPGSVISHYRIIELIARGGMGEVYKAVDTNLSRTVAIKIPNETVVENSKAKRRFLHEAHAASRLSHPNICRIYEVGEDGGIPFFVMEYIEGPTLQKVLSSGPLAVEQALRIAVQLADAIEEAHGIGIIHRDLKPSNVILNSRGAPVILDFGLAKRLRQHESHDDETPTVAQSLTTGATVVGTVAYMSPEQVRAATLDARSDIFSFGILLYEMLVGERPFKGIGQVEIMHAILHDEPPPPRSLRPELDVELERIVELALKKDVSQRYPAMAELKRDLYSLVRERGYDLSGAMALGSGSRSGSTTPPRTDLSTNQFTPQQTNWFSQSKRRWAGVAALALLLVIVGISWLSQRRPGDSYLNSFASRNIESWNRELGSSVGAWPRFSHDGSWIVFAKGGNGQTHLWVKQIGGGSAVLIPGMEGPWRDKSPIFSPDDKEIAFLSNRGGQGQFGIWTVPTVGGEPQFRRQIDPTGAALVSWSQDKQTIYFRSKINLYALNLVTGTERQLTNFPITPIFDRQITLSADERHLVYIDIQNGQDDIWVRSIEGGSPKRVTNDPAHDSSPLWHPDGQRILYNSEHGGITQIFLVDLDGGAPHQLTSNIIDSELADISSDGKRILYASSRDESDLWEVRLATGKTTIVTSDVGVEYWPDPSPDGTKLAFQFSDIQDVSASLMSATIISRELNAGAQPAQLTQDGFAPQWSKDGRHLGFLRNESGSSGRGEHSLWVIPAIGGTPVCVAAPGVFFSGQSMLPYNRHHHRDFSWHPDSQQVIYAAIRDGRSNIWMGKIGGSSETPLTNNETSSLLFFTPLLSPDGRQIAYVCRADRVNNAGLAKWSIQVLSPESSQSRPVFEGGALLRLLGWSSDGNDLFVEGTETPLGSELGAINIYRVSVASKSSHPIAQLKSVYFYNIQLAPDSRSIAYISRAGNSDRLEIISASGDAAQQITKSDDHFNFISNLTWSPDGKALYYSKQSSTQSLAILDHFK